MPSELYKYICLKENFLHLNGKNVLYSKVSDIINNFMEVDEKNYGRLRNNLCQFRNSFWYVHSRVYPEIYCSTERRGFDLKSTFHIVFKAYKDKKIEQTGKKPQNYVTEKNETCSFQQKPIEIDIFHDEEEKEIKERVGKKIRKRQEVVEKNKPLKRKKGWAKWRRWKRNVGTSEKDQ